MLTELQVKNFKALDLTRVEPKLITLFIGPNNSGKSSLGQAVLLTRQAAMQGNGSALTSGVQRKSTSLLDPYLYPDNQVIDLGDFDQVVRRGQQQIAIGLAGSFTQSGPFDELNVELGVVVKDNRLISHQGKIAGKSSDFPAFHNIAWKWAVGTSPLPLVWSAQVGGLGVQWGIEANLRMISAAGITYQAQLPAELMAGAQALQHEVARAPVRLLSSIHPIFPLRGLEERGSPLTEGPAQNLERMSVADRTVALLSMLAYDLDLQERVSDWLENLIGRRIKLPLLPGKRVTLLSYPARAKGGDSLFTNEGTGANQLPFILVPIGITPPGETILLTEPEAHLHPQLQTKVAALLLRLAQTEKRQFIIETHSEHVLHQILYSVAKRELSLDDLAIFYFEKKNETAECRRLEVNEKGQVQGGLPGFFEQSLSELSVYLDALEKK